MRNENILEPVCGILREFYGLSPAGITEQKGGWSARAFRVEAEGRRYFLKVYDKEESSTAQWTANLGIYLPFLASAGELEGWTPRTVPASDGRLWAEDNRFLTILADYIEGRDLGGQILSQEQASQLGTILGRLHSLKSFAQTLEPVREAFAVPFCENLRELLDGREYSTIPGDIRGILQKYAGPLERLTDLLDASAARQKARELPFVPCHTDIHGWNLMQGEHLYLIDWEGLRYAPMEADFFALTSLPQFPALWEAYRRERPEAAIDPDCLEFYQLRRRCEDIWEFAARILQDKLDEKTRQESFAGFAGECAALAEIFPG